MRLLYFFAAASQTSHNESTGMDAERWKTGWPELVLPLGIIACLLVIFVPLPPQIMDVLLAANIAAAVLILLTTIYVRTPIELSVFPSLLLATTFARLALNVATTRLILSNGAIDHESAAGQVIRGFGEFVAGDQIAIGLVIFLIIVIIQFVVITKGATRISEVTARFALDGMPGRQLSIDADLNSGAIDDQTARLLRQKLTDNADFYGAMDGASKFVRGDAIAGILITVVNIIGGLIVGMTSGMTLAESAAIFSKLTIGDGLVSQLPALLIAIAAALLVTRSTRSTNLPRESVKQLMGRPIVLAITGGFLLAMAVTELPKLPLLLLAALSFAASRWLPKIPDHNEAEADTVKPPPPPEPTIERLLASENLEMELGVELIQLADPNSGGTLLPSVTRIRKRLAAELGVILPKIRIRDNLQLPANGYRILVLGNPVDIGSIFPSCELAIDEGEASGPVEGAVATETTDDGQAFWIEPGRRESAIELGYAVYGATAVLVNRLSEVADRHAADLLTRDSAKQLIEEAAKTSPEIVQEVVPSLVPLKKLQQILKLLVAEQVSIRPLGLILETLADVYSPQASENWQLAESIRERLGPQITAKHLGDGHRIRAITVDNDLQDLIAENCTTEDGKLVSSLSDRTLAALVESLAQGIETMKAVGQKPIVCVSQQIRPIVSLIAREKALPMVVLGTDEIVGADIESVGEVSMDHLRLESAA